MLTKWQLQPVFNWSCFNKNSVDLIDSTFSPVNITGDNYYKLLDICFSKCDVFSLSKTYNWENIKTAKVYKFLNTIEPFKVKTITTDVWHCFRANPNEHFEIFLYNCNEKCKNILKQHTADLFFQTRGSINDLPEDICFFINNKLLLGTVSHEYICNLYTQDMQTFEEFKPLAKWYKAEEFQLGLLDNFSIEKYFYSK